MPAKILIHCGFDYKDQVGSQGLLERKIRVGDNTGNLMFPTGAIRTVCSQEDMIVPNYYNTEYSDEEIEQINAEYSLFIMPLADAFRIGNEKMLISLTKLVRRLTIPCVIIGVGLREKYDQELKDYPFDDIVKIFVKTVLEKSSIVGLRGDFTGKYLEKLGFEREIDFTTIGCPSMYMKGSELLIRDVKGNNRNKIVINANSLEDKYVNIFFRQLVNEIPQSQVILQKINEIERVYFGRNDESLNKIFGDETVLNMIRSHRIHYFSDPYSWINYMSNFGLCISSRFHGGVAGILAGTPTILVPIDSRMKELAAYHNFPTIQPETLKQTHKIETLLDQVDLHSPEKVAKNNYLHYRDFLHKNGIVDKNNHRQLTSLNQLPYSNMVLPESYYDELNLPLQIIRKLGVYAGKLKNRIGTRLD